MTEIKESIANLKLSEDFIGRTLNQGFSGGEKKKTEVLQMSVLKPKIAILDEPDSGLDIDALRTVAALLLMCDPRDLGVALSGETGEGRAAFEPNLYLYDMYPGGVGQSAPLYRLAPRLLRQTAELLAGCACESGCPSCAGPPGEIGERGKEAAMRILAEVMGDPTDGAGGGI